MANYMYMTGRMSAWLIKALQWRESHIKERNFLLVLAFFTGIFSGFAALLLKYLIASIASMLSEHLTISGANYVGVVDLFILLLEFRAGKVGMVLAAHLAIGLLDVVIAGRSVHAQYFVVVCHWFVPSCWMFASHCAIRLGQECVAGPSWARNAVRYRATARTAAMVVA